MSIFFPSEHVQVTFVWFCPIHSKEIALVSLSIRMTSESSLAIKKEETQEKLRMQLVFRDYLFCPECRYYSLKL